MIKCGTVLHQWTRGSSGSSWAATNSVNSSSASRKIVAHRHTTACNYTLSSFKDDAVMEPNFSQTNHPTKRSETKTIFTLLLTLSPSAVHESYEWRWQGRDCWGVFQTCGALITHLIWRLIGFATFHVINNNSLFGSRIPNHDFSIFWALGHSNALNQNTRTCCPCCMGKLWWTENHQEKPVVRSWPDFDKPCIITTCRGCKLGIKTWLGDGALRPHRKIWIQKKHMYQNKLKFKLKNNSKYKHLKMNDRSGSPKIHIHIWDLIQNFEKRIWNNKKKGKGEDVGTFGFLV